MSSLRVTNPVCGGELIASCEVSTSSRKLPSGSEGLTRSLSESVEAVPTSER